MYPTISLDDPSFSQKLPKLFREYGVVVIEGVLSEKECFEYTKSILDDFVKLGTGINLQNTKETWKNYNLPPQTRPGLFQALMSNLDAVWKARSHGNIRKIFELLYSDLRRKSVTNFVVSSDGINVRPGDIGPYSCPDWAHLDQKYDEEDAFACIQGQAVLTTTTASFVATPKSHLQLKKVLELSNHQQFSGEFLKFDAESVSKLKELFGESYQIPIIAPKGSFIVWTSSTIHSARLQTKEELPTKTDPYAGWRCVIYVCYRPRDEMKKAELKRREKSYQENRTTNHSVRKLTTKNTRSRYEGKGHPIIEAMLKDHALVYEKLGKPELDSQQKTLL